MVCGRQCRAKSSFVSPEDSATPKKRKQRRSLPTHTSDIVNLASKSPSKHRKDLGTKRRSSASVATPPSRGSHSNLSSMFECDENDTTLAPLTSYSKELVVDDHLTYGHRKCGYSNLAMSFEDFDIVGDSNEHRFPWQKDISIQCCLGDNLITNGMGYFPAWNSYLPRDRTSSLTRGEIPSHPNMFRPKSTGCLTTTLCKEDLQKLHLKHASNLTSPPNREKTNLLGRYAFYRLVS